MTRSRRRRDHDVTQKGLVPLATAQNEAKALLVTWVHSDQSPDRMTDRCNGIEFWGGGGIESFPSVPISPYILSRPTPSTVVGGNNTLTSRVADGRCGAGPNPTANSPTGPISW